MWVCEDVGDVSSDWVMCGCWVLLLDLTTVNVVGLMYVGGNICVE